MKRFSGFYSAMTLIAVMGAAASCGQVLPTPPWVHYDDKTGLVGVPTEEGDLAGTWAVVVEWANISTLPILGDRNSGAQGSRLVNRVWDGSLGKYREDFIWCSDEVFEVEGTRSVFDDATIEGLDRVNYQSNVEHARGSYKTDTVLDLWGVRDLPNGFDTPLPTKDNYQQQPQASWMVDTENDGHPGFTAHLQGGLNADAYNVARSVYVLDGTVLGTDRVRGIARAQASEQHTVAGSTSLVEGEAVQRPDPDPKQSWFDMVRVEATATCADVRAALSDGRLANRRPF